MSRAEADLSEWERAQWRSGLRDTAKASFSFSASPRSPLRGISSAECRQGFRQPSAVSLSLLQPAQKWSLKGLMSPTVPLAPGSL